MNNWNITSFLKFVIYFQVLLWILLGADQVGLRIPVLRQFVGMIYLSFIPGISILRILKLHNLGNIETTLYSIGLSISTIMFVGFFMNLILPNFGISKPFSTIILFSAVSIFVCISCFFCYLRDRDYSDSTYIYISDILSPPLLFLFCIPFLSIIGTYFVNYYQNNTLLIIMIFLIATVALFIGFGKFIPEKLYPFSIWVISISVIFHSSLISQYLNVSDVVVEYFYANEVVKNFSWNWTSYGNYNSILSTNIVAPIFHLICNLDLTWVFKIIIPFLYSFVALGSYKIFSHIFEDDRLTFLSSFLLVSISPFYKEVLFISKQTIAEFFLVILLMLVFSNIKNMERNILLLVFSSSLIVSHYGTSYLFMFSLLFILFIHFICKNSVTDHLWKSLQKNKQVKPNSRDSGFVSINFLLFYIVFAMSWYIYVSGSSTFSNILDCGNYAIKCIYDEILDPTSSRALYLMTKNLSSPLHSMYRIFYLVIQSFLVIGFFKSVLCNYSKFNKLYLGFATFFLSLLFLSIFHTSLSAMDPRRLFHLSLYILSPFSIIGGLYVCKITLKSFLKSKDNLISNFSLKLIYIFFVIFFLFNIGLVYEIAKDNPSSISISQKSITQSGDLDSKAAFYGSYVIEQDVCSGKWLVSNMDRNNLIYVGGFMQGYPALTIYGGLDNSFADIIFEKEGAPIKNFDNSTKKIDTGYIQLSYANIVGGVGSCWYNPLQRRIAYNFIDITPIFENKNIIYNNGGGNILY